MKTFIFLCVVCITVFCKPLPQFDTLPLIIGGKVAQVNVEDSWICQNDVCKDVDFVVYDGNIFIGKNKFNLLDAYKKIKPDGRFRPIYDIIMEEDGTYYIVDRGEYFKITGNMLINQTTGKVTMSSIIIIKNDKVFIGQGGQKLLYILKHFKVL